MEYANGGEVSYFFPNLCLVCLFTCAFILFELFSKLQWHISFSHWYRLDQWNLGSECNPFWLVWKQQSHSTSFFFKTMGITSLVDCQYLCLMRMSRLRWNQSIVELIYASSRSVVKCAFDISSASAHYQLHFLFTYIADSDICKRCNAMTSTRNNLGICCV